MKVEIDFKISSHWRRENHEFHPAFRYRASAAQRHKSTNGLSLPHHGFLLRNSRVRIRRNQARQPRDARSTGSPTHQERAAPEVMPTIATACGLCGLDCGKQAITRTFEMSK